MADVSKICTQCKKLKNIVEFRVCKSRVPIERRKKDILHTSACISCIGLKTYEKYQRLHPVTPIIDLEGEIWREISFNTDYEVSNKGRVKSKKYNRHKLLVANRGAKTRYLKVSLSVNDVGTHYNIHTLVATEFCPGKRNKHYQVNHKDGNTFNNDASNLEWVSPSYNIIHAFNRVGRPYDQYGKHVEHNVVFLGKKGFSVRHICRVLDLPYQYVRKTRYKRVRVAKSGILFWKGLPALDRAV